MHTGQNRAVHRFKLRDHRRWAAGPRREGLSNTWTTTTPTSLESVDLIKVCDDPRVCPVARQVTAAGQPRTPGSRWAKPAFRSRHDPSLPRSCDDHNQMTANRHRATIRACLSGAMVQHEIAFERRSTLHRDKLGWWHFSCFFSYLAMIIARPRRTRRWQTLSKYVGRPKGKSRKPPGSKLAYNPIGESRLNQQTACSCGPE